MPLTDDVNIEAPERKVFPPVPEDVYQVQITDVEERESKKYLSDEKEMQFFFKLNIIDKGDEYGKGLAIFTSKKWFNGARGMKASKLFSLIQTVYKFYYKDVDVYGWEASIVNKATVNDLIGKQLRVSVVQTAPTAEGVVKNKITGFMPIKKELPAFVPEEEAPHPADTEA